jgi:hypothetical protein
MARKPRFSAGGLAYHVRCGQIWSPRRRTGDGVRSGQDRIAAARLGCCSPWPLERPARWTSLVNQVQNEKELAALHRDRDRGHPYGEDRWVQKTASALGIESSLRPPGRPKKQLFKKRLMTPFALPQKEEGDQGLKISGTKYLNLAVPFLDRHFEVRTIIDLDRAQKNGLAWDYWAGNMPLPAEQNYMFAPFPVMPQPPLRRHYRPERTYRVIWPPFPMYNDSGSNYHQRVEPYIWGQYNWTQRGFSGGAGLTVWIDGGP